MTSLAEKVAARDRRSPRAARIEAMIDSWPTLTDQQRTALAELLKPVQRNRIQRGAKRKLRRRDPP